jgi:beta-mannosidase
VQENCAEDVLEVTLMSVDKISLDGQWLLKDYPHGQGAEARPFEPRHPTDGWISTAVPGDIHVTLSECGRLPKDLFVGMNVEQCRWTGQHEWWFRRNFQVPADSLRQRTELVFEGIDLYGTIWLNGREIGATENSFRPYRFDVTDCIRPGEVNTLVVRVGATLAIIEAKPWQKYFACFYTPRIFARKAQCQFGWDWAPHLPAVGIWRSVRLETFDPGRVMDVAVRPRNDGQVTFFLELDERPAHQDLDQKAADADRPGTAAPKGELVVEVTGPFNAPDHKPGRPVRHKMAVSGQKHLCTLTVPRPQLWWPNECGEQPLYRYHVKLVRDGRTHHEVEGRFAFREVRLVEEPMGDSRLSFRFEINGTPIFCKGANWVPASCFPATVTRERYRHLAALARDAHFNMLRVWGGGIYESDEFYDACDELGLMVWQDFMFSCSDYPDDDPAFLDLVIPEMQYQVRRLRNRPCVVYWCGGNEKTGSAGFKVHYGERLFHVTARGVCGDLDPTRPYGPASPHSYGDLGNNPASGDSHGGCYEKAYANGIDGWRETLREFDAVFQSEFGYHGPARMESMLKFIPAEMLWPINGAMEYHVQDNPYNSIAETFAHVQARMARRLVGETTDAESFVRCASTCHAEILRAEIEHHRARKWTNAGAMFWMFNDCWPCASWSVVDHYLLPKPAYYAVKRAFAPVLVAIADEPKTYDIHVVNDTLEPIEAPLMFGQGRTSGEPVWAREQQVRVAANGAAMVASIPKREVTRDKDTYLFARLGTAARTIAVNQLFHQPWREVNWPDPQLVYRIGEARRPARVCSVNRDGLGESTGMLTSSCHPGAATNSPVYVTSVTFEAGNYARMVHIHGIEGPGVLLSDNFFDLMPGECKTVEIRSDHELRVADIQVRHWLHRWDHAEPVASSRPSAAVRLPVVDVRRILEEQVPDRLDIPATHPQAR